jgi:hypothetical protein
MTPTASLAQSQSTRSAGRTRHGRRALPRSIRHGAHGYPQELTQPTRHLGADRRTLGRYVDSQGRPREVIACPGHAGSALVIDRDAHTLGDRRLVAHIAADEPHENAELVCRHYLSDPDGRWCRAVTSEDLQALDPPMGLESPSGQTRQELVDRHGCRYRLGFTTSRLSIPELRWLALGSVQEGGCPRPRSLREVVAALESYEPARAHTAQALARYGADPGVSVTVLRAELERIDASRIVLNRGLREAVQRAVQAQGLSMSEIALRCGRAKYDARGNASGETSWLARRVGLAPEGGESEPTPWIHSDVLALIARVGLGLSPREVELG